MTITDGPGQDRIANGSRVQRNASAFVGRSAAFGLVWWIVSGGATESLPFGAAAAMLAGAASIALLPPPSPRLRLGPLMTFVPYFLNESVRGGVDVVSRAFKARMPLTPHLITHDVSSMGPTERIVFALAVNLLPGTLSIHLEGSVLRLHAIDASLPVADALAELDVRIGAIFGREGQARRLPERP